MATVAVDGVHPSVTVASAACRRYAPRPCSGGRPGGGPASTARSIGLAVSCANLGPNALAQRRDLRHCGAPAPAPTTALAGTAAAAHRRRQRHVHTHPLLYPTAAALRARWRRAPFGGRAVGGYSRAGVSEFFEPPPPLDEPERVEPRPALVMTRLSAGVWPPTLKMARRHRVVGSSRSRRPTLARGARSCRAVLRSSTSRGGSALRVLRASLVARWR